jgi:hypothetical protein
MDKTVGRSITTNQQQLVAKEIPGVFLSLYEYGPTPHLGKFGINLEKIAF